jgi:hypothetical protein
MVTTGHQTQDTPETGHPDMMNAIANVNVHAAVIVAGIETIATEISTMMTAITGIEVTVPVKDSVVQRVRTEKDQIEVGIERESVSVVVVAVGEGERSNPGLRMRGSADKYILLSNA